ncbi:hypothetical protein F7725_000116 [Dissostichus mawsoni]|uniref:Uncharacterized protein n=1 Tax=Dissostichus mawsoni TaxID=36200 RepID=A0A7J5ZFA7_DISMA|nr:hypothetical protein F7725_000116 [Dissostichus mawsoni]
MEGSVEQALRGKHYRRGVRCILLWREGHGGFYFFKPFIDDNPQRNEPPLSAVTTTIFLLLTHSCAGGLPLGILLCQSEDEQTIAQGLEQLKQVVGEKGFADRGHEGPQLVITDDCRAERGALGNSLGHLQQIRDRGERVESTPGIWTGSEQRAVESTPGIWSSSEQRAVGSTPGIWTSSEQRAVESTPGIWTSSEQRAVESTPGSRYSWDCNGPVVAALKVELLAAVRQDERSVGLSFTADGGTGRSGRFKEPESGPTGRGRTKNGAGYLMDGAALAGGLQWQV